ncbi:hypothetical protein SESBI_48570 [Sesbania bispinosa]|nr:hypothetical protein SESBI_48570 [Sesbania bispinosa]
MEFDKREDNSINLIHNKTLSLPSKNCNKKRQLNNPMDIVIDKDGIPVLNRDDDSSWLLSADEDYIVFSFDVVKDCKSLKSEANRGIDGNHKNSRPVNRKLEYGEDAEQVSDRNIHEKRSNANMRDTNQQDQDNITHFKEDVEKEICLSRNQHRESMVRACQIEEIEDSGMCTESRDSNQSEGSTGSFAFPVLGWELIGSPTKMPKSEDLHLRKEKVGSMRFQCCRF